MIKLTLRIKVLIALSIFVAIFLVLVIFVTQKIIMTSFLQLENRETIKSIQRTKVVFDKEILNMDTKLTDWAIWDDTYQFIQDKNKDYIESNLSPQSLQNLNISAMYFVSADGKMLHRLLLEELSAKSSAAVHSLEATLLKSKNISSFTDINDNHAGVIKNDLGPVLFAARPVLKSDATGPSQGTLIFVRFYDDKIKKHLETVNNKNEVRLFARDSKTAEMYEQVLSRLSAENEYLASPITSDKVAGFTTIYDFDQKPVYILENEIPRSIFKQGKTSVQQFLLITIATYVSGVIFVLVLISKFVLSKISTLNENVNMITDHSSKVDRLDMRGDDEFANLAKNINKMLEDIKTAEEDLQKFRMIADNAYEHIIITDPDGKIIYANKAAVELTGYSLQEMIGKTPALWQSDTPDEYYQKLWDTIENKKANFIGEIKNRRKNGEIYIAQLSIVPILDKQKNVMFYAGAERNVTTERKLMSDLKNEKEGVEKKVEQRTSELNEEKVRLAASIASLSMGFIMTDKGNNIVDINQKARSLLCASTDAPLATIKDCTLEHIEDELKDVVDLRSALKESIDEQKPYLFKEVEFGNKFLKILISPIKNESEILGCVILIDDITEAKIVERSKDEFFSIASHELRTPLTAIRGNTSLIAEYFIDKIKDDQLKGMINDIHESAERLIVIVNDFLNTSRLEQGKMKFDIETFNIQDVIKEVVQEYQKSAKSKGIYLKIEDSASKIKTQQNVTADKNKVNQVLTNLVGNAFKFTEKGGVTISAQIKEPMMQITVKDSGRGISEEGKLLLFRKFQQTGESLYTRDTTKGTGLGLYISKLLVEGMGGSIKLERSEENKGSEFSFNLPIEKNTKQVVK